MDAFFYDSFPGRVCFGLDSVDRLPEEITRL
jgi:hypothetical protein